MKVCKFGGTSCATAEQIKKVCDIILSDSDRRLVVVSAPGKRYKEDRKVTDLLIQCAQAKMDSGNYEAELNNLIDRYDEIAKKLELSTDIIEVIKDDLLGRLSAEIENKEKFIDSLKAAGEDNCAKLVARYLKKKGIEAEYINPRDAGLFLSDEFGNARVLPESYDNLKALKEKTGIMIFPGFFGYSKSGEIVTFPRGGSDITGSILAAALQVDLYENFTDVDSVYVANPNLIENPKAISILTYREMRELSYAGFSVLHEETLEPVYHKNISVCIKNTNNPSAPGTRIAPAREENIGLVTGIASDNGFCSINFSKYMMNREVGFGRKVLQILEEESVSYEHIPSGIDNMSVIYQQKLLCEDKEKRVIKRIKDELQVDYIDIEHDLALVMIVGEGMMQSVGIAARATSALAKSSINIRMINQGSSEVSMMFGVQAKDADNAVKVLYNEFFN